MASEISKMLSGHKRLGKPKLQVSAYVSHHDDDMAEPSHESKWLKQDLKREQRTLKGYRKVLSEWDNDAVAAKAKLDVEKKLAESRLRVKDYRARIKLWAKEGK
jgi:rubrerythrin